MLTRKKLRARGWSSLAIDRLLPEAVIGDDNIRRYRLNDVLLAENTDGFRAEAIPPGHIPHSALHVRGWSKSMIRDLPPEPVVMADQRRIYRLTDIEAIEQADEFARMQQAAEQSRAAKEVRRPAGMSLKSWRRIKYNRAHGHELWDRRQARRSRRAEERAQQEESRRAGQSTQREAARVDRADRASIPHVMTRRPERGGALHAPTSRAGRR